MSNLFLAALQGLGGASEAYGGSLLKGELERDKRREEFQYRQQLQQELLAGRAAGGGGGKGGASFDPARSKQQLEFASGMTSEEMAKLEDGSLFDRARTMEMAGPTEDGAPLTGQVVDRPQGWQSLQAQKLADLKSLREAIALGGGSDYKAFADGRATDQQTKLIDQFKDGDNKAGEAYALAKKGSIFDGTSESSRNAVTGATQTTEVGKSAIRENNAQAAKALADAAKSKAEESPGGKAATVQSVISGEDGEAIAVMRDGSVRPLGIKSAAFNKQVADLVQKILNSGDLTFADLPPEQQRNEAIKRLTGKDPSSKSDAQKRPPLSSFMK